MDKEKRIKIPFKEQFRDAMLSGKKICTTRTKRYGEVGDIFEAFDAEFELVGVCPTIALWVGNFLYKEEGFEVAWDFHKIWRKLHPRLDKSAVVYVHFFRQISQLLVPQGELLMKASLTLLIAEIQGRQPNPEIVVILESWVKANDLHPEEVETYGSIEELREALKGETDGK